MSDVVRADMGGFEDNDPELRLLRSCVSERDRLLLQLLFGKTATQKNITCLTDGLDPDTENSLYMLLLGSVGFRQGWKYFQPYHAARFRGLHRYYHARNMMTVPWLTGRLKKLAETGPDILMLGDSAMELYMAGECPAIVFHYDIAVRKEDRGEAESALADGMTKTVDSLDRTVFCPAGHPELKSIRLVLQSAEAFMGYPETGIWERAKRTYLKGIPVYCVSPEDLMMSEILNWWRDCYIWEEAPDERLSREYRSMYLYRKVKEFDIEKLFALSGEIKREKSTYFWCQALQHIMPDREKERILELNAPRDNGYRKWLQWFL